LRAELAELADHIEPAHVRHENIRQHDIEVIAFAELDCFAPAGDGRDVVAAEPERDFERETRAALIVCDEHSNLFGLMIEHALSKL